MMVIMGKEFKCYKEKYRPQFHFSPERNWMNDPNGMVYYKGEYHLFYQYHPYSSVWGPMHWGHAVSEDMVHWEHLPIALEPDELGAIFSGGAVVDYNDSSGFFDGGSGLVAFYTSALIDEEKDINLQEQSIAYSRDKGRTWCKYEGNPVLENQGTVDFRDPKVMWHEETKKWVMTLAVQDRVEFYSSSNLLDWTFASSFGSDAKGTHRGVYECPDLFPLPVYDKNDIKIDEKWVLVLSVGDGNGINKNDPEPPAGGSGMMYFVGDFDGTNFTPDHQSIDADNLEWMDYGADFYAGVSWSNKTLADGQRLWLGWMSNWRYANQVPTEVWRSAMSIPRALSLKRFPEGIKLVQSPVEELRDLRVESKIWDDLILSPDVNLLTDTNEGLLEIIAEFELLDAQEFGFKVYSGDGQEIVIGYDAKEETVFVDRSKSGNIEFHKDFAAKHQALLSANDKRVKMHIFVDWSSVELFANDGKKVISDLIFPNINSRELSLYVKDGNVKLISLDIYKLRSIW